MQSDRIAWQTGVSAMQFGRFAVQFGRFAVQFGRFCVGSSGPSTFHGVFRPRSCGIAALFF